MSKKKKGGFLLGALAGIGLGVLFAPKKGEDTRADLKIKIDNLVTKAKDVDIDEVRETTLLKLEEIKAELVSLDKEKAIEIAKKKAEQVKQKSEDLVDYVIKKGTPVLEKAASSVKEKVVIVTKEVLNKLEEK